MQNHFFEYIILVLIILALVMLANRLKVGYPIVLVVGGLFLSFLSIFSHVTIEPDLVFFLFLPPLLYEAAWTTSWKQFWKFRRVIMSFAFPIVIITSCVIAFISKSLIPGFTLPLGFLLGGIISPPDAVSATAIMRNVKVPKSLLSVIEGESLLNDASSLIVFRFALAAVITGLFDFKEASIEFLLVIVMGVLIGIAVGAVFYAIHRWLPTTSSIEIVLTLLTPYCMYYAAEHFHYSGVLAVVSGGFLLSYHRQRMLNYRSRIEGVNVWTNLVFVMNGLVFLLIGLQLPSITSQLGDISVGTAIGYGLLISLVLIITRLACTFGAALFTRLASNFIKVADSNPGWKNPMIAGWAGMRGVVSLAAALSIPLMINDNQAFPYRNLILFITFIVILVTLVFQGLTLPWLIRVVKPVDKFARLTTAEQERIIQYQLALASINYINEHYPDAAKESMHLENLLNRLQIDLNAYQQGVDEIASQHEDKSSMFQKIYLELLEQQRLLLIEMNRHEQVDEDIIRKYLGLTDIEELKLRERLRRQ